VHCAVYEPSQQKSKSRNTAVSQRIRDVQHTFYLVLIWHMHMLFRSGRKVAISSLDPVLPCVPHMLQVPMVIHCHCHVIHVPQVPPLLLSAPEFPTM